MRQYPDFYKHLKAVTKEASDVLHGIKSGLIVPNKGCVDDILASEPSFKICVQYLTENPITDRLKAIQRPEVRKEEAKGMLLLIIKKYLGCPYITFVAVI